MIRVPVWILQSVSVRTPRNLQNEELNPRKNGNLFHTLSRALLIIANYVWVYFSAKFYLKWESVNFDVFRIQIVHFYPKSNILKSKFAFLLKSPNFSSKMTDFELSSKSNWYFWPIYEFVIGSYFWINQFDLVFWIKPLRSLSRLQSWNRPQYPLYIFIHSGYIEILLSIIQCLLFQNQK